MEEVVEVFKKLGVSTEEIASAGKSFLLALYSDNTITD